MTRFKSSACTLVLIALSTSVPRPAHAGQSYDNCTGVISSLPAVISTQGTWCLKQDLATSMSSGSAITIGTNNVTIDCNDFKLDGSGAGSGTSASGISAIGRFNATLRRCDIRGFFRGVYLSGSGSGGHLVENNVFDGNTFVGLWVEGDGSLLQRNRVFNSGPSTGIANAYGIAAYNAVDIRHNSVSGVTARPGGNGFVIGILTVSNPRGRITDNGVRGLQPDGTGGTSGIQNSASNRIAVLNNDLIGNGAVGGVGISCGIGNSSTKDNIIAGFVTGLSVCADNGNDITP